MDLEPGPAAPCGAAPGTRGGELELRGVEHVGQHVASQLDVLAIGQRGSHFADIVTAARDPESSEGRARRAALHQWEHDRDQNAFDLIAHEAGYEQ